MRKLALVAFGGLWLAGCSEADVRLDEPRPSGVAERGCGDHGGDGHHGGGHHGGGHRDKVEIWHVSGNGRVNVLSVSASAAAAHVAHGDWTNPIHVDDDGALDGSGLEGDPMRRIGDALAAASAMRAATGDRQSAWREIEIRVAPGTYRGSFLPASLDADATLEALPLLVDMPRVALIGASEPALDADGLPTGAYDPSLGIESVLAPKEPLGPGDSQPVVLITDTVDADGNAWAGHEATVSGFVLESGHAGLTTRGGSGVIAVRVEDVVLERLVFGPRFHSAFDGRFAEIEAGTVYAKDTNICTACLNGGEYEIRSSRIQDGLVGVFVGPGLTGVALSLGTHADRTVPALAVPEHGENRVDVEDSDLTGHTRNALLSAGLRVVALGLGTAPFLATSDLEVDVRDTRFGDSPNGVLVDAGFIDRAYPGLVSTVDVSLEGDAWTPVTKAGLVTTFTQAQWSLGVAPASSGARPYLAGASWEIDLDGFDEDLAKTAWIDHPSTDPTGDGSALGNTLAIGGEAIEAGTCTPGTFPRPGCKP